MWMRAYINVFVDVKWCCESDTRSLSAVRSRCQVLSPNREVQVEAMRQVVASWHSYISLTGEKALVVGSRRCRLRHRSSLSALDGILHLAGVMSLRVTGRYEKLSCEARKRFCLHMARLARMGAASTGDFFRLQDAVSRTCVMTKSAHEWVISVSYDELVSWLIENGDTPINTVVQYLTDLEVETRGDLRIYWPADSYTPVGAGIQPGRRRARGAVSRPPAHVRRFGAQGGSRRVIRGR
jgi:hypothetical protein